MRDVERISREALAQVREAVRGFRSRGLAGEVAGAKLALEAAGVRYDYYLETLTLPPAHEGVLALALREAVTNVVRHAGARHCVVRLERDGAAAVLEVRDDGVGGAQADGNGLSSMRARLQTVGGGMNIEHLHPGTALYLTVPLARPGRAPRAAGTEAAGRRGVEEREAAGGAARADAAGTEAGA
jgi:two-component system sensor histidine kinase DesK